MGGGGWTLMHTCLELPSLNSKPQCVASFRQKVRGKNAPMDNDSVLFGGRALSTNGSGANRHMCNFDSLCPRYSEWFNPKLDDGLENARTCWLSPWSAVVNFIAHDVAACRHSSV